MPEGKHRPTEAKGGGSHPGAHCLVGQGSKPGGFTSNENYSRLFAGDVYSSLVNKETSGTSEVLVRTIEVALLQGSVQIRRRVGRDDGGVTREPVCNLNWLSSSLVRN